MTGGAKLCDKVTEGGYLEATVCGGRMDSDARAFWTTPIAVAAIVAALQFISPYLLVASVWGQLLIKFGLALLVANVCGFIMRLLWKPKEKA